MYVLSSSENDKSELREQIGKSLDAVFDSFSDSSAFSGINPYELRKRIQAIDILPDHGAGFDKALEITKKEVLEHMLRTWSADYMPHLHSPALTESIASELIISIYNNSMDSWDQSPAATEIEECVCRLICSLIGYGKNSDAVFTSGGSQSNLAAITMARDAWCRKHLDWDAKKHGNPDSFRRLRLYTSGISHFSMDKSCHMLGLGWDAVVKLPVDSACRIDIRAAEEIIKKDVQSGLMPFCIVATAGTTDFGSVDNIAELKRIADRYGAHLHCDAAYGSGALMSRRYRSVLKDIALADSVTVDFHKMFLLPISCSAVALKDGSLFDSFALHADYLNRQEDEEDGYVNLVGKSIQTTRRADAIKVFFSFLTRGRDGFETIIDTCIGNAAYFYRRIKDDSDFCTPVCPELSSVVFCLNRDDEVNRKVRRALLSEGTVIGQTVMNGRVMLKFTLLNPALTHEHIDNLIEKIRQTGSRF